MLLASFFVEFLDESLLYSAYFICDGCIVEVLQKCIKNLSFLFVKLGKRLIFCSHHNQIIQALFKQMWAFFQYFLTNFHKLVLPYSILKMAKFLKILVI